MRYEFASDRLSEALSELYLFQFLGRGRRGLVGWEGFALAIASPYLIGTGCLHGTAEQKRERERQQETIEEK